MAKLKKPLLSPLFKLSLALNGLLAVILVLLCFLVYKLFENTIAQELYNKLDTRAEMTANINFAKDQPQMEAANRFSKLEKLEKEEVYLIEKPDDHNAVIPYNYKATKSYIHAIINSGRATLHYHKRFYAGFLYQKDHADYIAVYSATDDRIEYSLYVLKKVMLLSGIISLLAGCGMMQWMVHLHAKKIRRIFYLKNKKWHPQL